MPSRQRVSPPIRPKKPKKYIITPPVYEDKPQHPRAAQPKIGHAAAMEEYRHFKIAGLLHVWRDRWRHVLAVRHH